MAGLNKVMIIGNLGADPELRYSPQGTAFANFSVATSDVWTDKATGERQERTEWHRIVTFGKTAENCAKFLAKGRQVYVEGKLQTSSYEKDGQTHYTTKIMADVIHFLGGKQEGMYAQPPAGGAPGGGYQPPRQQNGGGYQGSGFQNGGPQGGFQGGNSMRGGNSPFGEPGGMGGGSSMPPEDDIPF